MTGTGKYGCAIKLAWGGLIVQPGTRIFSGNSYAANRLRGKYRGFFPIPEKMIGRRLSFCRKWFYITGITDDCMEDRSGVISV
jgi:hypothetical protein